jgi:hypothetical protein
LNGEEPTDLKIYDDCSMDLEEGELIANQVDDEEDIKMMDVKQNNTSESSKRALSVDQDPNVIDTNSSMQYNMNLGNSNSAIEKLENDDRRFKRCIESQRIRH